METQVTDGSVSGLTSCVISPQNNSPDFSLFTFTPWPSSNQIWTNNSMERLEYFSIFIFFLASDRKWQNILISWYSFILLVELVVDLDSLGDQAEEVEVLHVAGGVVQHPGLAVVVAVVGVAAVVSTRGNVNHKACPWSWLPTSAEGWWRWSRGRDRPRLQQPRWSRRRRGEWCWQLTDL